jgi:hypothetical protein
MCEFYFFPPYAQNLLTTAVKITMPFINLIYITTL